MATSERIRRLATRGILAARQKTRERVSARGTAQADSAVENDEPPAPSRIVHYVHEGTLGGNPDTQERTHAERSRDPVLFQEGDFRVTPVWLNVKHDSFAVRYISRLKRTSIEPPRRSAAIIFVVLLIVAVVLILQMLRGEWSFGIAWSLLAITLAVMVWAAWVVLLMPGSYTLAVIFSNQAVVEMGCSSARQLGELHTALQRAMHWHLGDNGLGSVSMPGE